MTLSLSVFLFSGILFAQSEPVAILNARVIDGTGAPARAATVVIRNGRIEAVSADAAAPPGARVIDAAGQTLLPGLFDLHTHLSASAATGVAGDWGKNLKAYLASGVTTVNDYATYSEMFAPLKQLLASGAVPGPHVNMATRMSTPGGHGTEGGWGDFVTITVNTEAQAHARMKSVLAGKPDVIKVFTDGWRYGAAADLSNMNLETLAAIVQDAHAAGLKVVTHTVTLAGAKIASRAGVDVLVHGIGDARVDPELIEIMKAKGTAYVSTLAVYEYKTGAAAQALPLLEPAVRDLALPQTDAAASREAPPERQRRWGFLTANVRSLFEAGIPVAVGTDAGMAGTYHGYSTLREFELLVQAGLTPMQAIAAGTSVSARAMGLDGDRGTIAVGKAADLVLVDGRPDERIADLMRTRRVFAGGIDYTPADLQAAIQVPEQTALPVRTIAALVDDMERADGRTQLGTLRVNATDAGVDHSAMLFQPVIRAGQDHALLIQANLAEKDRPRVSVEFPLTPGAIELADVSRYTGVQFDVRGEALGRLVVPSYAVRSQDSWAAVFSPSGEWQTVKIPFTSLERRAHDSAWKGRDIRSLIFEVSGAPGSGAWMELDNVRFY